MGENGRSRPRAESGSTKQRTNRPELTSIETAKADLGPLRDLLARHGHRARGNRVRCPSPNHPDRHPSASLYRAKDGDERVRCWSCGFDEDVLGVAEALGLNVMKPRPIPRPPAPSPNHRLRELARELVERPTWPTEWTVITTLAAMPQLLARQDAVNSWEWLGEHVDIHLVLPLSDCVRQIAHLRYPGRADAVAALLDEVRQ